MIRAMPADRDCLSCINSARLDLPPRERVHVGSRWRVAHAFGTSLPGWLVVLPRRHVIALDELTPAEAADLGPLLTDLTSALREVVCCDKTYVALFAEAEGFQHVHFHVVPRHPGLDAGFRDRPCSDCSAAIPPATSLTTSWTRSRPASLAFCSLVPHDRSCCGWSGLPDDSAHTLLKIAYEVLRSGKPYEDPGPDFYTRRESPGQRRAYLLRRLENSAPAAPSPSLPQRPPDKLCPAHLPPRLRSRCHALCTGPSRP
jgi:diadenosine tetraphosphate (Ap4A) HIT family hydrolase